MNARIKAFNALGGHLSMGKTMAKLSMDELRQCHQFIELTKDLESEQYYCKLRTHFVDMAQRPKNWIHMYDLLLTIRNQ